MRDGTSSIKRTRIWKSSLPRKNTMEYDMLGTQAEDTSTDAQQNLVGDDTSELVILDLDPVENNDSSMRSPQTPSKKRKQDSSFPQQAEKRSSPFTKQSFSLSTKSTPYNNFYTRKDTDTVACSLSFFFSDPEDSSTKYFKKEITWNKSETLSFGREDLRNLISDPSVRESFNFKRISRKHFTIHCELDQKKRKKFYIERTSSNVITLGKTDIETNKKVELENNCKCIILSKCTESQDMAGFEFKLTTSSFMSGYCFSIHSISSNESIGESQILLQNLMKSGGKYFDPQRDIKYIGGVKTPCFIVLSTDKLTVGGFSIMNMNVVYNMC
eukprot:TRINITY_DN3411_c0_g1_i1.p1 TRINITY_DN3411_c0_g1~~TRINITY_DN3411_c0_g1_i1.p1  ORF type:complete len:328 (-),score=37.28 TRINITY_DN3411_c0_g1_i1:122-1105(-)